MSALHTLYTRLQAMVLAVLVLAVCGLLQPARAHTFGAHLATVHTGSDRHQYQTVTPGLYWQHDNGATLGAYRNSQGLDSVYAAWSWHTADRRWAITAGAVGGYRDGVSPLLIPSVRLPVGDMAVRVALIPAVKRISGGGGLHLALEWGLW